mgnify:CR=1 FL=1|tara:strand:+ start:289 stop:1254 length:966 start_codon:yes stop_codon:yes gene_type:complete
MKNKAIIVFGGAGFIGSQIISHIHENDIKIIIIDNLCRGSVDYLDDRLDYQFEKVDIHNFNELQLCINKINQDYTINEVWHFAANSDIPAGVKNPEIDMRDTFLTTYNILLAIKNIPIIKFMFASSSAVYGDLGEKLISETSAPLLPISNYGAMKLASEAILSSYAEQASAKIYIFRFPNVVGAPATHGVIFDFINKLRTNPNFLKVLGNGTQQKPYLHVEDLIKAMIHIKNKSELKRNIVNIGPNDSGISVSEIATITRDYVSPKAKIEYGKEDRGWPGDVPKFNYDTSLLESLGFTTMSSSREAIEKSVKEIFAQLSKD